MKIKEKAQNHDYSEFAHNLSNMYFSFGDRELLFCLAKNIHSFTKSHIIRLKDLNINTFTQK